LDSGDYKQTNVYDLVYNFLKIFFKERKRGKEREREREKKRKWTISISTKSHCLKIALKSISFFKFCTILK